jgi:hypothetical protein
MLLPERGTGMHHFNTSSLARALEYLRRLFRGPTPQPPEAGRDPFAWRPVPRRPRPNQRSGAVAVAEPDE